MLVVVHQHDITTSHHSLIHTMLVVVHQHDITTIHHSLIQSFIYTQLTVCTTVCITYHTICMQQPVI